MRKTCFCITCGKPFEPGGIAGHRAAHRRRKEKVSIRFTHGNVETWDFTENQDGSNLPSTPKR
jgi:hypothetical protein